MGFVDKIKNAVEGNSGKAKDALSGVTGKAEEMLEAGVDKVNEKTDGKYSDKLDKAKGVIDKIDGSDDVAEGAAADAVDEVAGEADQEA